ncbi:hypothetical protein R1sor_001694 [Riccia sorocarpa]|uniref:Uncharacterized protein n=1 Tax=Riccia sorocarpa TaxID=122646 RepID=A0ABD3GWM9_9MARC
MRLLLAGNRVFLHRSFASCAENSSCKIRLEAIRQKENQQEEEFFDTALSQDVCLCDVVFGDGDRCYCGFKTPKPESGSSSERKRSNAVDPVRKLEPSESNPKRHRSAAKYTAKPSSKSNSKQAANQEKTAKENQTGTSGWDDDCPIGASICAKSVKNSGLHTFTGLIGYCLKDEKEEHFRMYQKNISEQQMEERRMRHVIYEAIEYKNRLEITPNNVLARALQFRKYRAHSPVSISFVGCLREMMNCGQYLTALRWLLVPLVCMSRAEKLWQMACSPDGVSVADVKEVYFSYVVPERYFSRSSHPGELQINRQTVTMKTPEYIPVNDEDEANPNRMPVATPNPGNPLETRCGIVDIDSPEWHDQSPQPETNQRNESTEQPATTNDDEEHVKEGNDEPMSLDVEALQRALIPSSEYFLIERDELPDATESDIELLLNSNYAIGSRPKPYKVFEGKPYVWPDFIDLVRPL